MERGSGKQESRLLGCKAAIPTKLTLMENRPVPAGRAWYQRADRRGNLKSENWCHPGTTDAERLPGVWANYGQLNM